MSVKDILLVVLGAALANNIVFEGFLGLPAVMGEKKSESKALYTGLAVAAVMLLSQAAFWPVSRLLAAKSLGYLSEFAAAAIVLIVVNIVRLVHGSKAEDGFLLVALSSAVLGLCVSSLTKDAGFGETMIYSLGAALGFLLAMLIFAGVRSRIDEKQIPAAFRGTPILLLAAFIIAMALSAYK